MGTLLTVFDVLLYNRSKEGVVVRNYSSLLCADTVFFRGMARSLDLGSTMTVYNASPSGNIADRNALANDWRVVGDEIRKAMQSYGQ